MNIHRQLLHKHLHNSRLRRISIIKLRFNNTNIRTKSLRRLNRRKLRTIRLPLRRFTNPPHSQIRNITIIMRSINNRTRNNRKNTRLIESIQSRLPLRRKRIFRLLRPTTRLINRIIRQPTRTHRIIQTTSNRTFIRTSNNSTLKHLPHNPSQTRHRRQSRMRSTNRRQSRRNHNRRHQALRSHRHLLLSLRRRRRRRQVTPTTKHRRHTNSRGPNLKITTINRHSRNQHNRRILTINTRDITSKHQRTNRIRTHQHSIKRKTKSSSLMLTTRITPSNNIPNRHHRPLISNKNTRINIPRQNLRSISRNKHLERQLTQLNLRSTNHKPISRRPTNNHRRSRHHRSTRNRRPSQRQLQPPPNKNKSRRHQYTRTNISIPTQ